MDITNKDDVREMLKESLSALNYVDHIFDSPEAIELLMGTWATESNGGHFLKQLVNGPALSAWQIEKPTFVDTINRVPVYVKSVLSKTIGKEVDDSDFKRIENDHIFASQIARCKYYLCPGSIPDDLIGQANYWKKYYNTPLGAGTVDKYISKYKTYAQ